MKRRKRTDRRRRAELRRILAWAVEHGDARNILDGIQYNQPDELNALMLSALAKLKGRTLASAVAAVRRAAEGGGYGLTPEQIEAEIQEAEAERATRHAAMEGQASRVTASSLSEAA